MPSIIKSVKPHLYHHYVFSIRRTSLLNSKIKKMGETGPGVDTVFDVETEEGEYRIKQGYLPIEGEQHYHHACTYRKYKRRYEFKQGELTLTHFVELDCHCRLKSKLGTRPEFHFNEDCHWKRIKDKVLTNKEQKTYLVRYCHCYLPEAALQPYLFQQQLWQKFD